MTVAILNKTLAQNGVIVPDWPAPARVRAGCTTRDAFQGVSLAPFHTFNVATHVGDKQQHVTANRRQLPFPEIAWLQQTHSTDIVHLQHQKDCQTVIAADASVTFLDNITCAVMTADCVPILLCDKNATWVAAIHAGWRGLALGIIEKALLSIKRKVQQSRKTQFCYRDIMVWIGPAISQQAFEVGEDVKQALAAYVTTNRFEAVAAKPGKYQCDLIGIAKDKLANCGISQIFGGDRCTYFDQQQFFSHRRDAKSAGTTGRMVSMICLHHDPKFSS